MRTSLLTFLAFLITNMSHAQDTLGTVYFGINQHTAKQSQVGFIKNKIDSILDNTCDSSKFNLLGHASSDGNIKYNEQLSQRRGNWVKDQFNFSCAQSTIELSNLVTGGIRHTKPELNRRVDVIYYSFNSELESDSILLIKPKVNKIYKDSTVIVDDQFSYVIPKELVEKIDKGTLKNFEVVDLRVDSNSSDISKIGFTQDENGMPLFSGGMFDINFDLDDSTCLDKPITLYFEAKLDCYGTNNPMSAYQAANSGPWVINPNAFTFELIKKDGKDYFKIEVFCPGKKNLDAPTECVPIRIKVKRVPKDKKIAMIRLFDECETVNLRVLNLKGRKNNRGKVFVPCHGGRLMLQYAYHDSINGRDTILFVSPVSSRNIKRAGLWRLCRERGLGFPFYGRKLHFRRARLNVRFQEKYMVEVRSI